MCVREQNPPLGQTVHIRRLGLRMSSEASNPIVEVVHSDEQHIRTLGRLSHSKRWPQ